MSHLLECFLRRIGRRWSTRQYFCAFEYKSPGFGNPSRHRDLGPVKESRANQVSRVFPGYGRARAPVHSGRWLYLGPGPNQRVLGESSIPGISRIRVCTGPGAVGTRAHMGARSHTSSTGLPERPRPPTSFEPDIFLADARRFADSSADPSVDARPFADSIAEPFSEARHFADSITVPFAKRNGHPDNYDDKKGTGEDDNYTARSAKATRPTRRSFRSRSPMRVRRCRCSAGSRRRALPRCRR
jgi:hypothetical protein